MRGGKGEVLCEVKRWLHCNHNHGDTVTSSCCCYVGISFAWVIRSSASTMKWWSRASSSRWAGQ